MATNLQKLYGMGNIKVEIVAFGRGLEILTPERFPGSAGTNAHRSVTSYRVDGVSAATERLPANIDLPAPVSLTRWPIRTPVRSDTNNRLSKYKDP